MNRRVSGILGVVLALCLFLAGLGHAQLPMRVGFNVDGPTDQDLAALNASGMAGVFANFATPLDTSQDRPGLLNIRILRHTNGCPTSFGYACSIPTSELAAFASANPGMTYELGSEPGNGGQDGLKGLATWVKLGSSTIKQADPTATVLGPGWLNWPSQAATFYGKVLGSVDGIAFHVYPTNRCFGTAGRAEIHSIIDAATSYAVAHAKPTYVTETSDFPSCSGTAAQRQTGVADEKAYLASKGVVAAIFFLERYSVDYPTGYLVNSDGTLTAEGLGWRNQ